MKNHNLLFVLFLTILIAPLSLNAVTITDDPSSAAVNHRVSLYLWGAGMKGNMGNAAGGSPVDISF